MADKPTFAPDYISHPGETLEDVLDERSMKQSELAERTGLSRKTVNEIIQGKAPITPETALHLERVLSIPARFWNVREQQYQEARARLKERQELENCQEWLERFPVAAMEKLGWISGHKDGVDQLSELLLFFGVASPKEWHLIWLEEQSVAFRNTPLERARTTRQMNETNDQIELRRRYTMLVNQFDSRKKAQKSIGVSKSDMQQKLSGSRTAKLRDVLALERALQIENEWYEKLGRIVVDINNIKSST